MNEYDDILNRIVEEFYDTGKVVLNEVGGFQKETVKEISNLSWEIFKTGQKGRGSKIEINNYISMIEKFLTLNDYHKIIVTEKDWWKPNDYVNIIDRYFSDMNKPIGDKIDFYERIKKISDKLDNPPFSKLKDTIKSTETFLTSKEEIEKKEEEETSFEKSIENIETQDTSLDFYEKIIVADEKNILLAFKENLCLYGELLNGNLDLRKLIMDSFTSKYCDKSIEHKCLASGNSPLIKQINDSDLSNKDKKALKTILIVGPSELENRKGCEDETPKNIINQYIKTFGSKKEEIEKELPQDSILNKNIKNKLEKCYSIIQAIVTEMNNNKVIRQKDKTKNIFSDLMDSIVTYTKGAGKNMVSTQFVDDRVEDSLNQIIYDLYQLLLIIQSYNVYDTKQKEEIKNIIKNISTQINNKEKLSENFFKIREIRNQKYEKSFECGGYFKQTKGGNSPKIISVTNNVQFLENLLEDSGKTPSDIVTIIYNEINGRIIAESLEKHDIKSNEEITLENGTIIPAESKIEVKLTSRYRDYHLSEFFGVYKNKPLDEYTDKYNQVISELKEMLKGDDKGIIQKIKDTTAGIFYENYMYTPIGNVKIEWSDMGQRPTEKRLSLRVSVIDESKISQWTKQNGNCNCEPFLKGVACPQNETTDRLDNIIENFFDTGKFVF